MKRILTVVFALVFTLACASDSGSPTKEFNRLNEDGLSGHTLCPDEAINACVIYAERYGFENTRIMYGLTDTGAHVQAQFRTDEGEPWQWLVANRVWVDVGEQQKFRPSKAYTVDEVFSRVRSGAW